MNAADLNYRHLLYFWMVAKEGSITRAAERLGLSVQTISTQLGQLERQLGYVLLAPQGRSLQLTESGRIALGYAEQIFHLGEQLQHGLAESLRVRPRFAVGVTDAVPKLVAFHLLGIALRPPVSCRLECVEGDFENLLGELALNRLDVVVADRSAPHQAHLKFHSHLLGVVGVDIYGSSSLSEGYAEGFPHSLDGAPMLLPVRGDPVRNSIDTWFAERNIRPDVVGEFSDSALLKTFGRSGAGFFPAPSNMKEDVAAQYNAGSIGSLEGITESWYAISTQRKIPHPAMAAILKSDLMARL